MITDLPELITWRITLAIADTEARMTGIRQQVRKVDGKWRSSEASAPPVWDVAEFAPYADRKARMDLSGTLLGKAAGITNHYRCQLCGDSTFTQPCARCRSRA